MKKQILLLLLAFAIGFTVVVVTSLKSSQDTRSQAAMNDADELITLNWPVIPDTFTMWENPPGSGKLAQILIKGKTYYYRPDITERDWSTGQIFREGTTAGISLPDTITSMAAYYADGKLLQTVGNGDTWYGHYDGARWTWSGKMLDGDTSTCGTPLPADRSVDTMTVFPVGGGKTGMTVTKNGTFYYKPDINTKTYTACGSPVPDKPAKFTGHAAFMYHGKLAELFLAGSRYWFLPDVNNRTLIYRGDIHNPIRVGPPAGGARGLLSASSNTISPYIFGANLVWHAPHDAFWDAAARTKLAKMISKNGGIGVTMLRFPGGCGGDAYNWLTISNPNNVKGITIAQYADILKQSGAEAYYTFNLESGHTGNNCHTPLLDYPGTVDAIPWIVREFTRNGITLKHVEIGNEPWYGLPSKPETWTVGEYVQKFTAAANTLKNLNSGQIKVTAATSVSWAKTMKDNPLAYAFQVHPYVFDASGQSTNMSVNAVNRDYPPNMAHIVSSSVYPSYPAGKKLAVTEYNLYCWNGIPKPGGSGEYKDISSYAYTMAHALYIAQMMYGFVDANVEYAMVWDLFEAKDSPWKCGLIRENSDGSYALTPAGMAFKMLSQATGNRKLEMKTYPFGLQYMTTYNTNTGKQSMVVVNPTNSSYIFLFYPGGSLSAGTLRTYSPRQNQGIADIAPVYSEDSAFRPSRNHYTITSPRYSIVTFSQ